MIECALGLLNSSGNFGEDWERTRDILEHETEISSLCKDAIGFNLGRGEDKGGKSREPSSKSEAFGSRVFRLNDFYCDSGCQHSHTKWCKTFLGPCLSRWQDWEFEGLDRSEITVCLQMLFDCIRF